MILYFIFIK